jgi:N-acetylglucosamine-6-phosphate deacetylase
MGNGKVIKALKKVAEGEHLAANALAVAAGKVKDAELSEFLSGLKSKHEQNAEVAGTRIKDLGGKYPAAGLKDTLKKGWEGVATSKSAKDAMRLLEKVKDDRTASMILRSMADRTESAADLSEKLASLKPKKKGARILGIPLLVWIVALVGGGVAFARSRAKQPESPTPPSPSGNSTKA